MSSKIALLTCSQHLDLTNEDKLLVEKLACHNVNVDIIDWRTNNSDLSSYPMVLIRSVWDYHKYAYEFIQFLDKNNNVKFFNSSDTIKWNMNKSYLLEKKFNLFVNSQMEIFANITDLMAFVESTKTKVVLKPIISAGARNTFLIEPNQINSIESIIRNILKTSPIIVQEYNPLIETQGELSLIFFDKKYSHAVRKTPKLGDFRVQEKFGGMVQSFEPDSGIVSFCVEILNQVKESLLYSRVDIISTSQKVHLMELELFEPSLFLDYNLKAVDRFTQAILSKI